MAEKKDIREKFGLDFLTEIPSQGESGRESMSRQTTKKETNAAFVAVGGRILDILKAAPDKSGQLHDLVEKTGMNLETLLGVVERLEAQEFVRVDRERFGNHRIRLTVLGEESFSKF